MSTISLDGATIVLSDTHLATLAACVANLLGDRFQAIETKLADIETKLEEMDSRLDENDVVSRVEEIESKIEDLDVDEVNIAISKMDDLDLTVDDIRDAVSTDDLANVKADVETLFTGMDEAAKIFAVISETFKRNKMMPTPQEAAKMLSETS